MRLDQKIAALNAQDLLSVLEPEALHVLAFSAAARRLAAGEELFRQGETADGGYVVVTGRLSVALNGVAVEETDQIGPGGLIGQAALFAAVVRPQTVIALEPSQLLFISQGLMRRVLDEHPVSAQRMQVHLADSIALIRSSLGALI